MTAGERIKYAVKFAISHALYALGLLQLWKSIVMRRKAVVLMYHRVLTREERSRTASHPAIVVDSKTFARQMEVLRRSFTVLSLEEFADRMERKIPFPDSSCLITFDDGWRDTFTHALPILRRHGLPAVVFLPVNFIGGRRLFWQEALAHLALRAVAKAKTDPASQARFRERLAAVCLEWLLDLSDKEPRPATVIAVNRLKREDRTVIEKTIADLADDLGVRGAEIETTDGFMDWEQVAAMSQHGVAFAGHGAEHRLLTEVSTGEALYEVRTAKDVLDQRFKETVPAFSYPNGDYSPRTVDMVKALSYRLAFTTRRGFVSCEDDRFTVRRINIHESVTNTTPMFLARLVGLF